MTALCALPRLMPVFAFSTTRFAFWTFSALLHDFNLYLKPNLKRGEFICTSFVMTTQSLERISELRRWSAKRNECVAGVVVDRSSPCVLG
jgi:hypothetical protein